MSELTELIDKLEKKIHLCIRQIEAKDEECERLKEQLARKEEELIHKEQLISKWEERVETLKTTSSMLGGDEYKRETKLKINALVRELDVCIEQLSK